MPAKGAAIVVVLAAGKKKCYFKLVTTWPANFSVFQVGMADFTNRDDKRKA